MTPLGVECPCLCECVPLFPARGSHVVLGLGNDCSVWSSLGFYIDTKTLFLWLRGSQCKVVLKAPA